MIHTFKNLTREESLLMLKAPLLVTVLVAAADNNFDKKEKEWAIKLTQYRRFSSDPALHDYYKEVSKDFEKKLNELIADLPGGHLSRNKILSLELEKLNGILPKLNINFAKKFHESLLSFAKRIAESSGGVLRFSTISDAEKEWIGLKMIQSPSHS